MQHDVFISYSSVDQKIAEGVCAYLEQHGIRCFVAYRDIPRGVVWAAAIVDALENARMMLVLFSKDFNESRQVDREIELAAEQDIPILTFRLSDAAFTGAKKYYLKNLNWIDAFPNPEQCFGSLKNNVCLLLKIPSDKAKVPAQRSADRNLKEANTLQSSSNPSPTPSNKKTYTVNGVSFTMVHVAGGTFTMGSPDSDGDAYDIEKPAHQVTLSSYSIGETQVTQALWQAVMGSNPSHFKGNLQCPVERVNWNDCQEFIRKLNALTGTTFRLPTEAEWEYAARGGSQSRGYKYSGSDNINSVAWYKDNSSSTTHPVKGKQPNELGLYDMSFNVWEWCADWFEESYYASSPQTNPKGPSSGSLRVLRGGSWGSYAWDCRVACRNGDGPGSRINCYGLRLAQ